MANDDHPGPICLTTAFQGFSGVPSGHLRVPPTIIASMRRSRWLGPIIIASVLSPVTFAAGQSTSPAVPSADIPRSNAETIRARALDLGYNLDYAEAQSVFREAITANPADPAGYRMAAATTWISMLFDQGAVTVEDYLGEARSDAARAPLTGAAHVQLQEDVRQAIRLAEARLRAAPSDPEGHYQLGATFGFLASYTATIEGRLAGSLGPARRAYHAHERVLALDPGRKDAGLIVGLYRYAVAALPGPLRLLTRIAGLRGDRERGLRLVEDAARHPGDAQPNALFTLVLLYNREKRYEDALRLIGELQHRYPRNRLLWLEEGSTALRAGRADRGRAALEEGLRRLGHDARPRARGEESRWRYAYGASLVVLNRTAEASEQLKEALEGATRDWVRGRCHTELGKLADVAGERNRAIAEYRQAMTLCRRDRDSACADEARRLTGRRYVQ